MLFDCIFPTWHCDQVSIFTFENTNAFQSWILKIDSGNTGKRKYEISIVKFRNLQVASLLLKFQSDLEVKLFFPAHTCGHLEASLERQVFTYIFSVASNSFLFILVHQTKTPFTIQQLHTFVSVTGKCELLIFHGSLRQQYRCQLQIIMHTQIFQKDRVFCAHRSNSRGK